MSYQRSQEDKRRLKKTYEETKNSYGPGIWYDEEKRRYIRADFTNAWLKIYCRRQIRHKLKNEDVLSEKSLYKRYFDYWWELF